MQDIIYIHRRSNQSTPEKPSLIFISPALSSASVLNWSSDFTQLPARPVP